MATITKNWDQHVVDAEEVARGAGFRALRDRIVELAAPRPDDVVVDVGAGTGLLRPGGRLVFGDMMFSLGVADARDRQVVAAKVVAMLRKGGPGVVRLLKNAGRVASGRWEHPARSQWWAAELEPAGFVDVGVEVLEHEGGLAWARKP